MTYKNCLILGFCLLLSVNCRNSKEESWTSAEEVFVYKKQGVPVKEINSQNYIGISNPQYVISILSSSKQSKKTHLWKGFYLIRIKTHDNKFKTLKVSNYDNFLYIIEDKKLYEISKKSDWEKLINIIETGLKNHSNK